MRLMPSTRKTTGTPGFELISTKDLYKDRSLLALIIDGEIVHMFDCDKRLSAILQSNPTVVELDGENAFISGPHIGWKYDGKNFIKPEDEF